MYLQKIFKKHKKDWHRAAKRIISSPACSCPSRRPCCWNATRSAVWPAAIFSWGRRRSSAAPPSAKQRTRHSGKFLIIESLPDPCRGAVNWVAGSGPRCSNYSTLLTCLLLGESYQVRHVCGLKIHLGCVVGCPALQVVSTGYPVGLST